MRISKTSESYGFMVSFRLWLDHKMHLHTYLAIDVNNIVYPITKQTQSSTPGAILRDPVRFK